MKRFNLNFKQMSWRENLVVALVLLVPLVGIIGYVWTSIRPYQVEAQWREQWLAEDVIISTEIEPESWKTTFLSPKEYVCIKFLAIPNDHRIDENVTKIMRLAQLEGLVLRGAGVKREHVQTLSKHPSLKMVVLSDTQLNDVDLGLGSESAVDVKFHDQDAVEHIERLQARFNRPWQGLKLLKCRYPDTAKSLVQIANLQEIERIDMRNCVMDRDAFKSFARLDGLKYLFVGYGFDDSMVDLLSPLKSLEQLDLSQSMVTNEGLRPIAQMPNLSIITLGSNMGDESMRILATCKTLQVVNCRYSQVGDDGVAALEGSKTIRGLDLNGRPITGRSLDSFVTFTQLQDLSFTDCSGIDYDDYKKLLNIPKLKNLYAPLPASVRDSLHRRLPGLQF